MRHAFAVVIAIAVGSSAMAAAGPLVAPSQSAQWEAFENRELNIGFQLPPGWTTSTEMRDGVPMLLSVSPDESMSLLVYAYSDTTLGTEELLQQAIDDLDGQIEGEKTEENLNGLHAWVATAAGTLDGAPIGLVIMAATSDAHNYVAYVFTDLDAFERNAEIMGTIIGTFAPLTAMAGPIATAPEARRDDGAPPASSGSGFVVIPPSQPGAQTARYRELAATGLLESIAEDINATLTVPVAVGLGFDACGAVNAFYDPSARRITICLELIEHLAERFASDSRSEAEMLDALSGAMVFVLFHEIGHALVDVLELPITGREEDAVDQLASYILTDGTDEGEQAALDGARWFYLEDVATDSAELAFWGEHSLNQQRFYNVLCWVYGQAEAKYADLVTDGVLPPERAARCAGEYAQIDRAWQTLLGPHTR